MATVHTIRRNLRVVGIALIAMAAMATQGQADPYDLTAAGSVTVNGGEFFTAGIAPTGSGNINSFVRVQNNGIQQGYNTDGTPLPYDTKSGAFTHSLLLSSVPAVQIDGAWFYEFGLDINQASSRPLLSLDRLLIFRESAGNLTGPVEGLGTAIYSLDVPGDNWITLDSSLESSGSGKGDMYAYIPAPLLFNAGGGDYVYLYSRFGDHDASQGGFAEWFVRTGTTYQPPEEPPEPPVVPAPAAAVLGMLGMSVAGWRLRRFA